MRAVLMKDGQLAVEEIAEPTPGPGEVLVETLAVGICGSDMSAFANGEGFNRAALALTGQEMLDLDNPIVLGHEFVARILSYGPETGQQHPVGTRVVAMPMLLRDPQVLIGFAGVDTPGAYAERFILSEDLLIPVPDEMSTELAALTEPMAVALHAVNRVDVDSNYVPLVLGCGPIGLAIVAMLKMRGLGPIVAVDLSPERLELAKKLGADEVIDPTVNSPYEAWMQAAATDDPALMAAPTAVIGQLPLRPTVGFESTGKPGLLKQMIDGAPPGSRISVAGINLGTDEFEPSHGILKELDLRFCLYYTPEEFAQTVSLLDSGRLDVSAMVTGRVGFEGVAEAFERLAQSPADGKILIDPGTTVPA
ncbi:MAG: zinc-binding dehydrogenase [Solirubrobacterales bacterium]|nr:zinc-binding dehydrogenase [Solirubrobacterales bacterium]HRV59224.1 zinc-binding dehydrogenase [Solirubrobacterales bacterium]